MTVRLTCACGVLLEIDDKFAGQTIYCPDCQRPVQTPRARQKAPRRTSGLAIASITAALVGMITVIGTLAAVMLGGLALRNIARRNGELGGTALAWSGILLGALLTGVGLFAYQSGDLLGAAGILRQVKWAGKLRYPTDLTVRPFGEHFELERPSDAWGILSPGVDAAGENDFFDAHEHLVLINVEKDASATCLSFWPDHGETKLANFKKKGVAELLRSRLLRLLNHSRDPDEVEILTERYLGTRDGLQIYEVKVQVDVARRRRVFLVHLVRLKEDHQIYVIAVGCRAERFERLNQEIDKLLESFRVSR